jgi:hypothetical protein
MRSDWDAITTPPSASQSAGPGPPPTTPTTSTAPTPESPPTAAPAPTSDTPQALVETRPDDTFFAGFDRDDLLDHCREMDHVLAMVLLATGIVYALFGRQWDRLLVTLNWAGLGVWLGWFLGKMIEAPTGGMIVGGAMGAAAALPSMRLTVSIGSAIVGFVLGAAIWRSFGLLDAYTPAGGAVGAVFLAMLTFVRLRVSITVLTAAQGAVLLLAGLLGTLMKYPDVEEPVGWLTQEYPVSLPVAVFAVAVGAIVYQISSLPEEGKTSSTQPIMKK